MFAFDPFVSAVVRRARGERFVRLLGSYGTWIAGIGFAVSLIAQFVPIGPTAARILQLGILAVVPVATLAVSWLAARKLLSTSDILFDLDRRLSTEARISSLFVLVRTGQTGYFADQLIDLVARRSEGWQQAYRPTWRVWGSLAAATCLTVAIGALASVEKAPRVVSESPVLPPATVVSEAAAPEDVEQPESEVVEEAPMDWIAQALADLEEARETSGPADVPEEFDPDAVELYTSALLEEMREEGARPLTSEELERLSDLATTAPPELGDALDAVLAEDDPDDIERQLEVIADYAQQQAQLADLLAAEDRPTNEEAADQPLPSSQEGGDEEDTLHPMTGFDQGDDTEPSLREAPLPGEPGTTGDVFEYITGGVPIELRSDGEGTSGEQLVVDYERVQTILDTRALPEDAFETVRRYYELVANEGET